MERYYTIGSLKPLSEVDIKKIEDTIGSTLPEGYKNFLMTYGFGDISELLMITLPDKDYFRSTFQDALDIWELTIEEEKTIIEGIIIARTIDGDTVLLIPGNKSPFVVMPRHSMSPVYFSTFNKVINFYVLSYKLEGNIYFDSYDNFKLKVFSDFVQNGILNKPLFEKVHKRFIDKSAFDRIIENRQPKYII